MQEEKDKTKQDNPLSAMDAIRHSVSLAERREKIVKFIKSKRDKIIKSK